MISLLITTIIGIYALKLSVDGFNKGRIILQRETRKKDGTVVPAKYVEGGAAKTWAVVLLAIGIGMLGLTMWDAVLRSRNNDQELVDAVTDNLTSGR